VLAVDGIQTRLALALDQNAEVIDFDPEDPVEGDQASHRRGRCSRIIDAVGIDVQRPSSGPAAEHLAGRVGQFDAEQREAARAPIRTMASGCPVMARAWLAGGLWKPWLKPGPSACTRPSSMLTRSARP
jgi:threonine dehydrogenase-like Zn-dependent dehydrogenase